MKKQLTAGLAAFFVTASVAPAVLADGQETATEDTEQAEESPSETNEGAEELIDTLTLDEAIDYALQDHTSMTLLNHRLENLRSQIDGAEDDYRDLERDLDDLEDEMDDLRDLQKETGTRTFQSRLAIQDQTETMEDTLEQLEDTFVELESNQTSMQYDREELEESVRLSTVSTFTQLVMTENQLDHMKNQIETERQRVENVKTRYELGVASRNEFHNAQRELTRLRSQIEQTETQLENDSAVFALDIGIVYHPDLNLEAPDVDDIEFINQEMSTEELIENSYSMKKAKEALSLAEYNRDQVYEDDDATRFDKEQADIAVTIEEDNITQLREDLKTSIDNLFTDITNQYQSVMDARYELDYAQEDSQNLKLQKDIGLVSEADYELAHSQVEQAEFDYQTAKQNYFLLANQVESLRAGLVQ